jgi:DNA-binding LytR/AlgR family response regulator
MSTAMSMELVGVDRGLATHVAQLLAGSFELDTEIGRGGMGVVYRARDLRLKRTVAIKVLPPELAFRADIRTRFQREAEIAARLSHRNIVPIYAVDERDGIVFFVMEYVEGDNLATRVGRGPAVPIALALHIMHDVAAALGYAHAHDVIHRDIKPDNILLPSTGSDIKVTDFGIARAALEATGPEIRITGPGVAIGTPAYMSPEQCAGDTEIDGRSDLYSLGVVAYHMLTGSPPFKSRSSVALLAKHVSERPVAIDRVRRNIPGYLSGVVMRLLEKDPDQRFETAAELIAALEDTGGTGGTGGTGREDTRSSIKPARATPDRERRKSQRTAGHLRRVLIADDEPLARERVRMMLARQAGYEIVAECRDGPDTVEAIVRCAPDIVFLDIKMPGLDGFDVLAALEENRLPPAIVFVTAFNAFATQAFDVSAVDYLLKPFDAERFQQALTRAEARLANAPASSGLDPSLRAFLEALRAAHAYPDRFLVRAAKHLYFVRAADIEWVDAAGNYVRLHAGGRPHFVRDTMKDFAEKLHPDRFVRVHRSIIVNIDHIQRLEPCGHGEYVITLRNGARVTSSRAYSERLHALLQ